MNQHIIIEYPCGCRWAFPVLVDDLPRNCPDHWPADKGYKLEDECIEEPSDAD